MVYGCGAMVMMSCEGGVIYKGCGDWWWLVVSVCCKDGDDISGVAVDVTGLFLSFSLISL